ncbi:MAG: hypothetical protein HYY32_07450 [Chloroflexi bacterium]|nr:hypothetical protein [Chloroflexota bacterium]
MVANAFAGLGFTPEAPTVTEFPIEMFVPGSDLSPLEQNIDKVVYGLSQWQPGAKKQAAGAKEQLEAGGRDYEEASSRLNQLFLRKGWGDGLPLLPPTEERVSWILSGTDLPRDRIIGKILPQGRIATVETLAINLAMAGGRPEYLPVLIAAIEGIIDPAVVHQSFNATTCSIFPAMIVNGPVARQIRLNSGYGCLGPSSRFPAGGSIGRAVRLLLVNVGGAVPGLGSMSIFGGAGKYTNVVFAEDEEGLPEGWEPLSASYFGYSRGSNTVAVHPVSSCVNVGDTSIGSAETVPSTLHSFAANMRLPNMNYWLRSVARPEGTPGIVVMARGTARGLARFGWTREKVQAFLWEHSKVPWQVLQQVGADTLESRVAAHKYLAMGVPWPVTERPEDIMIVVAGGQQSGHGYWMQNGPSFKPVCKEIRLPPNWDSLLKQAEEDLGPVPGWL